MKTFYLSVLAILAFVFTMQSQTQYDFGFQSDNSIVVKDSLGDELSMPWVGGLNAVHFQNMDLNLDGVLDLIVFDTHGGVLKTFLNNNITDSISYTYAPQYINQIPRIQNWIQTYDYDGDGKLDIFTCIPPGIRVFRNTSTSTELKFTQVTYMLNYFSDAGSYENIYVSSVDFPAFADVDFDGDMDILTFHVLGTFVIWYKNYSMELTGEPGQLEFKIADKCWGKFAESESSNSLFLDQICNYKMDGNQIPLGNEKHVGSTLLALNLNGDSLMDLILGDVDYFTLNSLINDGSRQSAHIASQDTVFPSTNTPVDLVSFNAAQYLDVDNDNVKELIVGPFDPSYYKTKSENSIWLYENNGTTDNPVFDLKQTNFLQREMIEVGDGSNPTIVDVNNDGLMDILVGNFGKVDSTYLDPQWLDLTVIKISSLTYYENIGTINNPSFQYKTADWGNFSNLNYLALKTTFGDLDGDGDVDMIFGNSDGKLGYCENTSGTGMPIVLGNPQLNYLGIDVGGYSTPQLIDINGDSLLDLVIGSKVGWLTYYENTGTATNPNFTHITDSMGNVSSGNYWNLYFPYSYPNFYYDQNDSLRAMVGSASGYIFYYKDIQSNITGKFSLDSNLIFTDEVDTLFSVLSFMDFQSQLRVATCGFRSAPAVYDFDHDGFPDIISGTFAGGLNYYKGISAPYVGICPTEHVLNPNIRLYPNPSRDNFTLAMDDMQYVKTVKIEIMDLSGRLMYSQSHKPSSAMNINVNELKSGLYLVNVHIQDTDNQTSIRTVKLIKN